MAVNELSDVMVEAISVVTKGANRKRFFLRKSKRAQKKLDLIELPSSHTIAKTGDWSTVYCVVAEPGAFEDAGMHGDQAIPDRWANPDEIRKAAHRFMKNGGLVNLMHRTLEPHGTLVENAIALDDFEVDGELIRKGSWYVAFEPNQRTKDAIDAGEFGGISIQGSGQRSLVEKSSRFVGEGGAEKITLRRGTTVAKKKPFEEQKHPRKSGQFTGKGQGTSSGLQTKPDKGGAAAPTNPDHDANVVRTSANILQELGYKGNLKAALKQFQNANGLPNTGDPDEATMKALRQQSREHKAGARRDPATGRDPAKDRKRGRAKRQNQRRKLKDSGAISGSTRIKKFNARQPRGPHTGRWIHIGGGEGNALIPGSMFHGETDAMANEDFALDQKIRRNRARRKKKIHDALDNAVQSVKRVVDDSLGGFDRFPGQVAKPKKKNSKSKGINLKGTPNEQRLIASMRRERPVQREIAAADRFPGRFGRKGKRLTKNRPLGHGGENWITRLPKPMQTAFEKSWIHRAATHLVDKGNATGHAIATAINAAKKGCATGDLNFPGLQSVNAGSKAEMCASVSLWEAMKAASHAQSGAVAKMDGDEETAEGVTQVFAVLGKFDPSQKRGEHTGKWIHVAGTLLRDALPATLLADTHPKAEDLTDEELKSALNDTAGTKTRVGINPDDLHAEGMRRGLGRRGGDPPNARERAAGFTMRPIGSRTVPGTGFSRTKRPVPPPPGVRRKRTASSFDAGNS